MVRGDAVHRGEGVEDPRNLVSTSPRAGWTLVIFARVSRDRTDALHRTRSGSAHPASTRLAHSADAAERPQAVRGRSWSFRLASSVQLSEWRRMIMRRGAASPLAEAEARARTARRATLPPEGEGLPRRGSRRRRGAGARQDGFPRRESRRTRSTGARRSMTRDEARASERVRNPPARSTVADLASASPWGEDARTANLASDERLRVPRQDQIIGRAGRERK